MYYTRQFTESDIPYLADNIKSIDILEVEIMTELSITELLYDALNYEAMVVIVNEKPEAIYGCVNNTPWFLSSEKAFKNKTKFLRTSRLLVDGWKKEQGHLQNYVHTDNHKAIVWLKFLGFTFHETVIVRNHSFIRFSK